MTYSLKIVNTVLLGFLFFSSVGLFAKDPYSVHFSIAVKNGKARYFIFMDNIPKTREEIESYLNNDVKKTFEDYGVENIPAVLTIEKGDRNVTAHELLLFLDLLAKHFSVIKIFDASEGEVSGRQLQGFYIRSTTVVSVENKDGNFDRQGMIIAVLAKTNRILQHLPKDSERKKKVLSALYEQVKKLRTHGSTLTWLDVCVRKTTGQLEMELGMHETASKTLQSALEVGLILHVDETLDTSMKTGPPTIAFTDQIRYLIAMNYLKMSKREPDPKTARSLLSKAMVLLDGFSKKYSFLQWPDMETESK